jgi:hypothetical protein
LEVFFLLWWKPIWNVFQVDVNRHN